MSSETAGIGQNLPSHAGLASHEVVSCKDVAGEEELLRATLGWGRHIMLICANSANCTPHILFVVSPVALNISLGDLTGRHKKSRAFITDSKFK